MQTDNQILRQATIGNEEPGDWVRLVDGKSSFGPKGVIQPFLQRKDIGAEETQTFANHIAAQGKFMDTITKMSFDDLREGGTEKSGPYWTAVKTIDGTQFAFSLSMEEVVSSIDLILVTDEQACIERAKDLEIDVHQTYIEIDGQKYFVNMSVPMNFSTGENDNVIFNLVLAIIGDTTLSAGIAAIIAAFGLQAFKEAFKHMASDLFKLLFAPVRMILGPMFRFASEFILNIFAGNGAKYALEAAAERAVLSFKNAFKGITRRTFAYGAAGAFVLIAVWAFFTFVFHHSFQRIYIYNLTKYNLKWGTPYIFNGANKNTGGDLIKGEAYVFVPHVDPELWYNGSGFSFNSDSQFHGLGYAMTLDLLEIGHDNPNVDEVYQSFTCMFDIPFAGENSLSCQVGRPDNLEKYYKGEEGKHKVTQMTAENEEFEITVTYDFLSNKHEDPITGEVMYLYNSLVIIREKDKIEKA